MHVRQGDITPPPAPLTRRCSSLGLMIKADEYMLKKPITELMFERQKERDGLMKIVLEKIGIECTVMLPSLFQTSDLSHLSERNSHLRQLSPEHLSPLTSVLSISCL